MPDGDPKALVQRLWDFCDVLRDDGLSYGDYGDFGAYRTLLRLPTGIFYAQGLKANAVFRRRDRAVALVATRPIAAVTLHPGRLSAERLGRDRRGGPS